ncbi:MAG: glycosyltransferase [Propionibacteriales bacterium]|nr:glycosyltransferase [Propionibacteriales bacterium]
MPDSGVENVKMPDGVYLTLTDEVRASAGGQTRAMIMRNRLITRHTGIPTTVLTVESKPIYPEQRAGLVEQGVLIDGMRLLNIYEWYREQTIPDVEPTEEARALGGALPELEGVDRTLDEMHPDGTVYYTRHLRGGQEVAHDYRRADGSVFLRRPAGPTANSFPVTPYVVVREDGVPVDASPNIGGWHWHWLRWLAGDAERVFLVTDSRFALGRILPRADDRFFLLHLIHNNHTVGQRRWDSQLSPDYAPLFNRIRFVDGLVTLTQRQSQDVGQRFGHTNNLFVVPNPVELPELPEVLPEREKASFVIVSRLEKQKRLHHAVEAFAKVVAARPEATLRIYGHGKLGHTVEAAIEEFGVGDNVKLMGFDPGAKHELIRATGFLMTSTHEGYPLATLESMAFGCPVISYDVRYGPRDQIEDGVDGFIVPAEDMDAMAERCIRMIDDPALVEELSRNAYKKAADHDWRRFLRDWKHAFETAVEQRVPRVDQATGILHVHELGWAPPRTLVRKVRDRISPDPAVRTASAAVDAGLLVFAGTLLINGEWDQGAMDERSITIDAISPQTGEVVTLPVEDEHVRGGEFNVWTRFDLADVFAGMSPEAKSVRLEFRFTARNFHWATDLHRRPEDRPSFEVSFGGPRDAITITRS